MGICEFKAWAGVIITKPGRESLLEKSEEFWGEVEESAGEDDGATRGESCCDEVSSWL